MTSPRPSTPALDAFLRRARRTIRDADRAEREFVETLARRGRSLPPDY